MTRQQESNYPLPQATNRIRQGWGVHCAAVDITRQVVHSANEPPSPNNHHSALSLSACGADLRNSFVELPRQMRHDAQLSLDQH